VSELFENANQIWDYLKAQGYQGSYNKIKRAIESERLKSRRGGGFTRRMVDAYALANLRKAVDDSSASDAPGSADSAGKELILEDAATKLRDAVLRGCATSELLDMLRPLVDTTGVGELRQAFEAIKAQEAARTAALKRSRAEGALAPWRSVEEIMTAKAAVLRTDLRNLAHAVAGELVFLVAGDPAKVPELQAALQERFDDALHRYSAMREFEVLFTPEEVDADDASDAASE
jgi:hypothetical protein